MAKDKFIVGEHELNQLKELNDKINNVAVSTELIKGILHQVIFTTSFVKAVQKFFLSQESNFLTPQQKETFAKVLHESCLEESSNILLNRKERPRRPNEKQFPPQNE